MDQTPCECNGESNLQHYREARSLSLAKIMNILNGGITGGKK